MNSSVKNSIIFTVFDYNELILLLQRKFVHLSNVLLYFVFVVFSYAADIIACASDEIDVVDETSSRLIGPTSEVLDRLDVFSLVSGSLRYRLGMIIGGEIASSMILVNHDCVA